MASNNKEFFVAGVSSRRTQPAVFPGTAATRPGFVLHPLTFPEAEEADNSHFICRERDVPIVCLFSSCEEVFGRQNPALKDNASEETKKNSTSELELTDKEFKTKCSLVNSPVQDEADKVSQKAELLTSQFSIKDQWMRHLFLKHKLVVDNVEDICSLRRYTHSKAY